MMPYTSVGMPANTPQCSMPNTMFAPGMLSSQQQQQQPGQHQQSIMFSGASGNFFLAQPTAVGGAPVGTPVMLTQGHGSPAGTFMVAQPMPPNAVPGAQMANSAPTNCIIQLPDGRLVMQATGPQPVGFNPSNLSRLSGAPTAYYSMPMTSGPPVTSNQASLPQQQPSGLMASNQGHTFFIQVPSNAAGNYGGGAVLATGCTASGPFQQPQQQSTGLLKPAQAVPCVGAQPAFSSRPPNHPVLMSVAVSSPQGPCVMSHKVSNPQNAGMSTGMGTHPNHSLIQSTNPPPMDAQQLVSNQQKLCSIVGVSSASLNNLQSLGPSGMAVARLPNGTYTTVAYNRPQTPTNMLGNCPPASGNGALTPVSTPLPGLGTAQRKTSAGSRSAARQQSHPSIADSAEVLRRLDEQIVMLQNVSQPTEVQSTKLKQLIDARNQLAKTVAATGSARPATDGPGGATNLRPVRPQVPSISPALRRELLNTLATNNLLPTSVNCTGAETFVVEFRLNQQQYRVRLTRSQKTDMERLLFSVSPQRQAELLTVLQQEQNRHLAPRPRVTMALSTAGTLTTTTTTTTMVVTHSPMANVVSASNCSPTTFGSPSNLITQPMRLQAPMQAFNANPQASIPMHPHTFSNTTAGLRLVATRPVLQPAGQAGLSGPLLRGAINATGPGICGATAAAAGGSGGVPAQNAVSVSSAPVMGVVTALAMPPMAAQGPGTPIFAPGLGSTTAATIVPHGVPVSVASGGPGAGTTGGLFLSSFPPGMPGSQTFVMQPQQQQQPVMVSSSTGPMPLPTNCALLQHTPAQPVTLQQQQQAQQRLQAPAQQQQQQPLQSQLVVSQPIRTATPAQATSSPPVRAVGLSLQQAARLSRMRAYLSHDLKASVERPPSEEPGGEKLPPPVQLLQALAPYHMLRDADNTEEALEKVERILDTSIALLFERKRQTILAVDALLFKQTMEQMKPQVEDRLLLAHMALDLDRDVLAAERQDFTDALGLETPKSNQQSDGNDPQIVDTARTELDAPERPVAYLRHPDSLLPPSWQAVLGPLAFLRPLKFDENGNASYASIDLPPHPDDPVPKPEEVVHECQPCDLGTTGAQSAATDEDELLPCINDSVNRSQVDDNEDEDGMSDEVEADLLLGLGTRQSRGGGGGGMTGANSMSVATNGLHGDRTSLRAASLTTGVKRNRDKCVTFEETYNLWQELMREEGMEMDMGDENSSVVHAIDGADDDEMGADALDASLDSRALPDESSRNSLRGLDNGPAGMQHSEDPDIDAAIRSILSTSN